MNKNIIIVSGTGQNVGKTTFVCLLINKFKQNSIIAIKVSPHFHEIKDNNSIILKTENFIIINETNLDGKKDSSKMLVSGAKSVYYIQAKDEYVFEAFEYLQNNFLKNQPIIFESASIAKYVEPAYHFVITSNNQTSTKKSFNNFKNPILIENIDFNFKFDFENLQLIENKWFLNSL